MITRRSAKFFIMKCLFYDASKFFRCMKLAREKLEMKSSTSSFKNTNMFCNICRYDVRSKQFFWIFVCYSQEARKFEQPSFRRIKLSRLVMLKSERFCFCRAVTKEEEFDIMWRKERRSLMLALTLQLKLKSKRKSRVQHNTTFCAHDSVHFQRKQNMFTFKFFKEKLKYQVTCQTKAWLLQPLKQKVIKTFLRILKNFL